MSHRGYYKSSFESKYADENGTPIVNTSIFEEDKNGLVQGLFEDRIRGIVHPFQYQEDIKSFHPAYLGYRNGEDDKENENSNEESEYEESEDEESEDEEYEDDAKSKHKPIMFYPENGRWSNHL